MEPRQEDTARLENSTVMTATGQDANLGSGPVRGGYEVDGAALAVWMGNHVDGFDGPLHVEQFRGGQSNPTYKLITPSKSYVMRRKPPGQILKGAHAVEREARVQLALATAGFPVAKVHGLCEDAGVLGSAFYVMDLIDGRIFWDARFPDLVFLRLLFGHMRCGELVSAYPDCQTTPVAGTLLDCLFPSNRSNVWTGIDG